MHLRDVARGGDGLAAPILLLLPHEPLLLLPGNAAFGLASALVLVPARAVPLVGWLGSPCA